MRLHLTPLLTDHAVVQRHQSIPVWGRTDTPGTRLSASLNGMTAYGISGDDCRFLLRLPPMDAGGPYTLRLETLDDNECIEVRDILIGEVWLASGQSNMQWEMCNSDYEREIADSHPGQVRMINVARRADHAPQSMVSGTWELSSPMTTGMFSAVATFFGNRLRDELDIPVGIIHSSWGGTFIQTWISRERLLRNPAKKTWVEEYEAYSYSSECWDSRLESRLPQDPGNDGINEGWHESNFHDGDWDVMTLPGFWQEAGHNYSAVMWFRTRVTLPDFLVGRDLTLHLGAVDKHDITYVNGREVGRTGEGFDEAPHAQSRHYAIPAALVEDNSLVIAVRAYSFMFAGGLTGPAEAMRITARDDDQGDFVSIAGDWRYQVEHNFGFIDLNLQGMGHGIPNSPCMLFENMIRPLLPVAIAGAIWYQGESNAGQPEEYRALMQDLIEDWRYHFGVGEFPFLLVQLANYLEVSDHQPDSSWARLREAQLETLQLPHTGMAVIIDAGDAEDVHPRDKKTVGHRLAQWALARVYSRALVAGSPVYSGHRVEGTRIRIFFDDAGTGLALKDGDRVRTLVVGDRHGNFYDAESRIECASLVVWHDAVRNPAAVRYAWADNPEEANLVNALGFPASPFRTDRDA